MKVNWLHIVFTGEVLEGLSLGLGNEHTGEDTGKHEYRVDLHDVVEPWAGRGLVRAGGDRASSSERSNGGLSNDGANFAGTGRDTVGGRAVSGWETLARYNEGGCVGA